MLAVTLYCLVAIVAAFLTLRDRCPHRAEPFDVAASCIVGLFWPFYLVISIVTNLFRTLAKLYNKRYF